MIILSAEKKAPLEQMHPESKDGRHRDRMKAVLLAFEGWDPLSIAQALRLTEETVRKHIRAYERNGAARLTRDSESSPAEGA